MRARFSDIHALAVVFVFGCVGWLAFMLLAAASCGAERNDYPCVIREDRSRLYLACNLGAASDGETE